MHPSFPGANAQSTAEASVPRFRLEATKAISIWSDYLTGMFNLRNPVAGAA